jgi:GAF domain-containing protein
MLEGIYQFLLVPRYPYTDNLSQLRARVTLFFGSLFITGSLLIIVGIAAQPIQSAVASRLLIGAAISVLALLLTIGLVHQGLLRIAVAIMLVWLLGCSAFSGVGGIHTSFILTLTLPILYASLIWSWRGTALATTLAMLVVLGVGIAQIRGTYVPIYPVITEALPAFLASTAATILTIGLISGLFAFEIQRAIQHITRLLIRLRATAEVATQASASGGDLAELLKRTVNYIRDRFAFYHVQIFLVDRDSQFASLAASTSEGGESLTQRGYRLAIGTQSTIGQAIMTGEPIIVALDENIALSPHVTEMALEARSELALPLAIGDQAIGVLDVQSARPNAFNQEDIDSLQIIATHVSVAISNAKLFEEQRNALNENRRLFLEAELNLREIQRLNQRLTGQAWEEYLRSRNTETVGYTLVQNQLRKDTNWTPMLEQAASKRRPMIDSEGDRQVVAVPVELRGRIIGAIEVEMGSAVRQSDALEMLQSVAQRLALSIDNARLFEQAQELAQQEFEVNTISARIQGATSMDEIAELAISELGRILGAEQASIRLGVVPTEPSDSSNSSNTSSNGSGGANGGNGARI